MTVTVTHLKKQLKRKNITQDQIAERAGVTRTYVNHYLNGRRQAPKVEQAIRDLLRNGAV